MRAWSVVCFAVGFLLVTAAFQEAFLFRLTLAAGVLWIGLWCWDRADKRERETNR